jgi:hypothetical protein
VEASVGGRWRQVCLQLFLGHFAEIDAFPVASDPQLIGVHKHHTDNLVRMLVLVGANKKPAHRLAYEHAGGMLRFILQRSFPIVSDLLDGVPLGSGIAPAITGTVMGADACRVGNLGFDQSPVDREATSTGFGDYSRTSLTRAI